MTSVSCESLRIARRSRQATRASNGLLGVEGPGTERLAKLKETIARDGTVWVGSEGASVYENVAAAGLESGVAVKVVRFADTTAEVRDRKAEHRVRLS